MAHTCDVNLHLVMYVRNVSTATVAALISENRVCPVLTNKFCLLVRSHYHRLGC
eukprot:COSAG02_NODE_19994_length_853_cov_1.700265_1_plen_53_part_10